MFSFQLSCDISRSVSKMPKSVRKIVQDKLDRVILNVLKYFEHETQNQCVTESFLAVHKRTSLATGICERTITNVLKRNQEPDVTVSDDDEEDVQNHQPTKREIKPRTRRYLTDIHGNTKFEIRNTLYDMVARKEFLTLDSLLGVVKRKQIIDVSRSSLYRIVKDSEGFQNICKPKGQASGEGSSSAGNVEINENTRVGNLPTAEVNFEDNTDDQTDNAVEVKAEADDADVHLGSREGTSEDNSNELGHDPLDYVDEIKTEVDDSDVYLPPTQASFEGNVNETSHDQPDRVSQVKTEADEIDIKEELVSSFPHAMKRKRLDAEHASMDFTDSVKTKKSPLQEDEV
jgi:hypothetical protein